MARSAAAAAAAAVEMSAIAWMQINALIHNNHTAVTYRHCHCSIAISSFILVLSHGLK